MANDQEKRIKGKGLFTVPTVEEMIKAADAYRNAAMTYVFGPKTGNGRGSAKRKVESLGSGKAGKAGRALYNRSTQKEAVAAAKRRSNKSSPNKKKK